jgi:glycosyltransferase involved in cell wall biosynthesis
MDYKGLDILLRSIIELQKKAVPVHLILAGAGSLEKHQPLLRRIQNQTIDNRPIPDEDVFQYFQMSTIVALPYREASQSGIAAIAMPAGVPIVATRVGALPEILHDQYNSLLVEPGDVESLTNALTQLLLDQNLRHRLVEGARQTVQQQLLWPHIAGQYHQHYQALL